MDKTHIYPVAIHDEMYRQSCPLVLITFGELNHGSDSYLTCVKFSSFFLSPGWPPSSSEPNTEATSFQRLPGDFKYLSNKEQRRRQREEKGAPLLSRGLRLPIILSTC